MLFFALLFLIIGLVAYFMGAGHVGSAAVDIAKWCFILFIVLLVVGLLLNLGGVGWGWGWPIR